MLSKNKRIFQVLLGVALIFGLFFVNPWLSLIGFAPLLVGITGFCPACYFLNRCSLPKR